MDNIINSSTPTVNTPEINPTPSSHPKPLLYIFLVVVLLLVGVGGFVLGKFYTENKTEEPIDQSLPLIQKPVSLPTTNSTAGWKTYTNIKYSYEIKYPQAFYINSDATEMSNGIVLTNYDQKTMVENESAKAQMSINIADSNFNSALKEMIANKKVEMTKGGIGGSGGDLNITQELIIGDKSAIKVNENTPTALSGDQEMYYVANGNTLYRIQIVYGTTQDNEKKKLFDQILSTFRFLDETVSSGSNDWKSYQDNSISFKYPPAWDKIASIPQEYENKMFNSSYTTKCSGPILQNTMNSSLIVFDLSKGRTNGTFCWSSGKFEKLTDRNLIIGNETHSVQVDKWMAFDPASGGATTLPWDKDIFELYSSVALISKEENRLNSEYDFDQILSTFKFIE